VSDIGIPAPASGNRLFKPQWPLIGAADPSQVGAHRAGNEPAAGSGKEKVGISNRSTSIATRQTFAIAAADS